MVLVLWGAPELYRWLASHTRYTAYLTEMASIIHQSRSEFVAAIFGSPWYGQEREAVRLAACGYLLHRCRAATILYDPCQIGIEVRGWQPRTLGVQAEVYKDLVLWAEPGQTCWASKSKPVAVLAWKAGLHHVSAYEVAWLHAFTTDCPQSSGYAVSLDLQAQQCRLRCVRVQGQAIDQQRRTL